MKLLLPLVFATMMLTGSCMKGNMPEPARSTTPVASEPDVWVTKCDTFKKNKPQPKPQPPAPEL